MRFHGRGTKAYRVCPIPGICVRQVEHAGVSCSVWQTGTSTLYRSIEYITVPTVPTVDGSRVLCDASTATTWHKHASKLETLFLGFSCPA